MVHHLEVVELSDCTLIFLARDPVMFTYLSQDVFIECEDSYGPIEEMNVCDNLGDHLVGNVYIKVCKH